MTQSVLDRLSFADLRDRLKARRSQLNHSDTVDLMEALRHLTALPEHAHTPDSIDALIELGTNFFYEGRPKEGLQAESLASRLATTLEHKPLLCRARAMQGGTFCDLGRFTEAAVAYAESWMLARTIGDARMEVSAIKSVGGLYSAMAQWEAAIVYYERARAMAAEHGLDDLGVQLRNNIANCALRLGDPIGGLRAILPVEPCDPKTKREATIYANTHDTLGNLYLATGDMSKAKAHAEESGRLARLAGVARTVRLHEALMGLIDVHSGEVERGLVAIKRSLEFAKRADAVDVSDYLGMCIRAYEAAGQSDNALMSLQELAAWKKRSIEAELLPAQYEGLKEVLQPQSDPSVLDSYLLVKAQQLHAGVRQSIQNFAETAINAEITSGHDLYRTFRVAKLARCLATALAWDEERIDSLALAAQLCNIGMIVVPTRILLKPGKLSDGERLVVHGHAQYGADLLRKSKIRILEMASVVAEQHHERFDGRGYPRGLDRESIAEEARLVAICDAFDAMTHQRPWRKTPLSVQAALRELKREAGAQFDPMLVSTFVDQMRREFWEHDDFDAFLAEGADEHEYVRARARMEALISEGR